MTRKGPIATLLAGLALGAVLLGLSANASGEDERRRAAGNQTAAPAQPTPTATPGGRDGPTPTTAPTRPAAAFKAAYAGRVSGGGAALAIAVNGDRAIAYLCDGRRIEAWLQGSAANGELNLTGAGGATLTGSYTDAGTEGTVRARGQRWTFDLAVAKKPSGLWRATASIRGATVVGGWIVLANGDQVGLTLVGGVVQPAPRLDPVTGTALLGDDPLTAREVDASVPLGS